MYFPYVYGRQSELRALQALNASCLGTDKIVPIIEPVVKKTDDLLRCLGKLGDTDTNVIVILNPDLGDFKDGGAKTWRQLLNPLFKKYTSLIPALKCGPKTSSTLVDSFLKTYPKANSALIYCNSSFADTEIAAFASNEKISTHIVHQGKITAHQRAMLPSTKIVEIADNFNKQARNADYSGTEFLTDRHKTFSSSGIGFGDYTITGSLFQPGGGKPGAVALHSAYRHPGTKDIWMEHFVSDDIDINTGSAASKYLEAVSKLAAEITPRIKEFGTNLALEAFVKDHKNAHFPGLGKSKERQIYHHVSVMHDILAGKL